MLRSLALLATAVAVRFVVRSGRRRHRHARVEHLLTTLEHAEELAGVGFWEMDVRSGALKWSEGLHAIYGTDPASGAPDRVAFFEMVHPDDRRAMRDVFRRLSASETVVDITFRIFRRGELRWLQARAERKVDRRLGTDHFLGVTRDITEEHRKTEEIESHAHELEEEVRRRTAQLDATNRELEAFSYSVSHDLRTPLRSIDGFSQALLEDYGDKFDADGRDYLQRVRAATQRMGRLIDDLLALSRVSRSEMQARPVDLSALAQQALQELREQQPERQVECVVAPGLTATGDPTLLGMVLHNLLGNAWKYTSRHSTARVEFGVHEENGQREFFVRDDGAGFDPAHAGKLFAVFQRLHRVDEFEGTGVGLATVARIVHRHGGDVRAEGAVERGATFYFTLPGERAR